MYKTMAKEKPAIPMLEMFLHQVERPEGSVSSESLDWPLAIGACLLLWVIPAHGWLFLPGLVLAWLVLLVRKSQRNRKIQAESAAFRAGYERWKKVNRMVRLLKDWRLAKRVPAEVLLALEQCARTWHDARETLQGMAVAHPEFANEIQTVLDASMMAAADPVILREEQTSRDLARMEADRDLMSRLGTRIMQEQARMQMLIPETASLDIETPQSLRSRLDRAQAERAAALSELDLTL